MTDSTTSKQAEIHYNLERFLKLLPDLTKDHRGQFALLRHGSVIDFFRSAMDAQIAGNRRFADRLFSIQMVEETAEELGFLSYALHSR